MVEHVFLTFCEFSSILMIFICAFGFTFNMLMGNKLPYQNWYVSLLSILVIMTGEQEYQSIILGDRPQHLPNNYNHTTGNGTVPDTHFTNSLLSDRTVVYLVHTLCLIVMSIVVMNLMTALAVDDIEQIRKLAVEKQLSMYLSECLKQEFDFPVERSWIEKLLFIDIIQKWRTAARNCHITLSLGYEIKQYENRSVWKRFFQAEKAIDPRDFKSAATDPLWRPSDTLESNENTRSATDFEDTSHEINKLRIEIENLTKLILKDTPNNSGCPKASTS